MDNRQKSAAQSIKQRIAPTLLLAFAISMTLFFFGPFDLFCANKAEFHFVLRDFFDISAVFTLIFAGVICAILLPLRGRAFEITYAVFSWLALMLIIQGNYLNFGLTALVGDGTNEKTPRVGMYILNTLIWLAVGAGIICARIFIKNKDIVKTVTTVALITVIGMQAITFTITAVNNASVFSEKPTNSSYVGSNGDRVMLTGEHIGEVSRGKNIYYFVIDRFDAKYAEKAMTDCPEVYDEMDGFTYFDDNIAFYARTYPSICYMLTGVNNRNFDMDRHDYFDYAYSHAETLKTLKENNYAIHIYTQAYYAYENAAPMTEYAENTSNVWGYRIPSRIRLTGGMFRLSLFRYLPFLAKKTVDNMSTDTFLNYVKYDTQIPYYEPDMKDVYEMLSETTFSFRDDDKNNFTFLHIEGCHLPNEYGYHNGAPSDFLAPGEKNDSNSALKQSFSIINRFLKSLKELGVYDDATIIITGDHAAPISDFEDPDGPRRTAMFFKRSEDSFDGYKVSHAPVTHAEIWPTIMKSAGINVGEEYGKTYFDYSEGEERTRYYDFQLSTDGGYEVVRYRITGSGKDFDNWTIYERVKKKGSFYD